MYVYMYIYTHTYIHVYYPLFYFQAHLEEDKTFVLLDDDDDDDDEEEKDMENLLEDDTEADLQDVAG